MQAPSPKSRIGKAIFPRLAINRRTFDILRYEANALMLLAKNAISPHHRSIVARLAGEKNLSVNLGSGGKGLDGWVNVEFRRAGDTVLELDIRKRLPLRTASVKRVIAEHVLEHLDFQLDAPNLSSEVYRILQPGGIFRVVLPDCEKYLRAYVSGDKEAWRELDWDLDAMPSDIYTPMHIINHVFHQGGEHLFGYDFETLSLLLRAAGFTRVEKMSYGKSLDPELAIDQPNHAAYSLYVDAVKAA